jgi:hypothetical protein
MTDSMERWVRSQKLQGQGAPLFLRKCSPSFFFKSLIAGGRERVGGCNFYGRSLGTTNGIISVQRLQKSVEEFVKDFAM